MDPNATLEDLRWLVSLVTSEAASGEVGTNLAVELADKFDDLDTWLSNKSGFLPDDWDGQ